MIPSARVCKIWYAKLCFPVVIERHGASTHPTSLHGCWDFESVIECCYLKCKVWNLDPTWKVYGIVICSRSCFFVGHSDRKLPTTSCNFTGWTPLLHRLSLWSGGNESL